MFVFRWIANGLAPLTLLGAIAAYLYPPAFLIFKDVFLWLFAATMFALGVVLDTGELRDTLKHPGRVGLGVLTQFTVMPTLAFAAAWAAGLPPELALGFIIVGCAPGAMASNVIVYLAGGAVAFSVALTTVATVLSPVLTPSLVEWLGGVFLPIPFWPMMLTILKTVLAPLLIGIGLQRVLGKRIESAKAVAPGIAALAIVIICSYAVASNHQHLSEVGPVVIALVVLINLAGYALGWGAASLFGFDRSHTLTLSIEIGMQNAGLGVALALAHFTPLVALPGVLFAVWCILTAAGASAWLRRAESQAVQVLP
ncbi:MAG: bile acid:sodium symporter family protein [Gammaproteobacteria bacterium]|nr:bile acid:sodium symporter family protein [Gammaproteobacteria bacterium]MCP5136247.1 bile acid:sodium symporter family protein [Gammaproteobacteria bacterium]